MFNSRSLDEEVREIEAGLQRSTYRDRLFADSIECVVLNACYSEQQARAIAQHIPYVIGMNQAIDDRAAIEFLIGFYDALGAGETIQRAYDMAVLAIAMAGISEHSIPKLLS